LSQPTSGSRQTDPTAQPRPARGLFPARRPVRHWPPMPLLPRLLAHASGFSWDEALLVMAPLVVIGALLWLANRRASRLEPETPDPEAPSEAPSEP
jgi:hypothetical protein